MPNEANAVTQGETPSTTASTGETPTTPETSETLATTSTPSLDDLHAQVKRMEAALKKANTDAASHRAERDELKKFKAQIEAEKLSDTEKQELARKDLEKQLADLQKSHDETRQSSQTQLANYEIQLQAATLGVPAKNLDKVAKLVRADIEFEDGKPTNVKPLLDALLKDMPELIGKTQASSGGATNPSRSSTSGPQTITREYVASLKPSDYNALSPAQRQAIAQWIAQGGMQRRN